MTPLQRQRAGQAVAERMAEMAATPTTVARAAGIDPKTLRSLLRGERWPTDAVQARVEAVLRWRDGELTTRAVLTVPTDAAMAAHTDAELAAELFRRLANRERRETLRRRSTPAKRGTRRP